ncbi:MAG: DUF4959 domain-containing protein [Tannerella sp.]|jgi:hypothetical protein|nr:DUF4959 domain-containing protein [Tannerella sp.]
MKYRIYRILTSAVMVIMTILFFACAEEERITYYDTDATAPVSLDPNSVSVKNLAGKSVIKYQAPNDANLLYVKAVYKSAPGVTREARASLFVDTLLLDGFNAAGDHTVKLFCVGKNEKTSEAIEVTVSPSTPPVIEAFPSLEVNAVFGGVRGNYQNLHESELKVYLLADTANTGRYELLRAFVSNSRDARFLYLGLQAKEARFAAYLQDRWGNRSDTLFQTLTPDFEVEIDKDTWSYYSPYLDSDCHVWLEMGGNLYHPSRMWDNENPANWNAGTIGDAVFPFTTTIKLGKTVRLSHITIYAARMWGGGYTGYTPKLFEVYGSNVNTPGDALTGGDWTLLGDFVSEIPSGNAEPTQTDKDQGMFDGEVFFFEPSERIPDPYLPTQFIRFRFLGTWNGMGIGDKNAVFIGELDVWGQEYNN